MLVQIPNIAPSLAGAWVADFQSSSTTTITGLSRLSPHRCLSYPPFPLLLFSTEGVGFAAKLAINKSQNFNGVRGSGNYRDTGIVPSEVRLLCDLEQPEPTWTVRHIGGSMRGAGAEQISVLVRNTVESKASKNVLRLFYSLGYKLEYELLKVGFAFHFQRGAQITVTVSSVNKMLKLHATDEAVPVTPGIQLVEVTAPATSENYSEVVAAVSSFCEHLAPLLHLSKPGISTGVVPTAAAAAASLMSDGGGTTL
ncbi:hypothetical protein L484_021249 [Morus notabilis]|uniref:Mediator of RNA polymerase II transcription subunit 18 n=1 Tax=Morus notabilis TaxID=981085 RepID=W9RT87_9ROSA|nr:hypothetical protein L484_021249 [Morus notabilis]